VKIRVLVIDCDGTQHVEEMEADEVKPEEN